MNSNFDFLLPEWNRLYDKARKAELRVMGEPETAAFHARQALEEAVIEVYALEYLDEPFESSLFNRMSAAEFKSLVPTPDFHGVFEITRKHGNTAAHNGRVAVTDAIKSLIYLQGFLKWFANSYSEATPDLPLLFDERLLPPPGADKKNLKTLQAELERLQSQADAEEKARKAAEAELETLRTHSESHAAQWEQERLRLQAEIAAHRRERDFSRAGTNRTEAETRADLIDAQLQHAGWHRLRVGIELEYPVSSMPVSSDNPRGNGRVDYVLWDEDGKPLAVIEAKRTGRSAEEGRIQAALYADCLEREFGRRPIIFYANGYDTYLWDDAFYPPRKISGFLTRDALQWRMQQRGRREDIRLLHLNAQIANRDYQEEAWRRTSEVLALTSPLHGRLTGGRRNALLVMATGSGKTRTAAAIVEQLFKASWVRRVLFLADRKTLVSQACGAFKEHLPDIMTVNLLEDKDSDQARVIMSTYPTMLNRIESTKPDGTPFYGAGHFDLIVVDEAHRSIYNRYGAIFAYFDALRIGLTATPKGHVDHNTYELFDCQTGDPTFSYELDAAVRDEYLVPPRQQILTTRFLQDGIHYKDLSKAEQEEYEDKFFGVEGDDRLPDHIDNKALVKWLFNEDTVHQVLRALMETGLKIEGGDKLGRTIIFAANKDHAAFIQKIFDKEYPEYGGGFMQCIYHGISQTEQLIRKFQDKNVENLPHIAVSVDMLDTGVDAPRVLNLVFFKTVRSYSKFWQMIGRGTRLCPDVFGPGEDKECFYVFDACGNFEFFDLNPEGVKEKEAPPLSALIFQARLTLSQALAQSGTDENLALSRYYLDLLHHQVELLQAQRNRVIVQLALRYVDAYAVRERWDNLSNRDIVDIKEHLSRLPLPDDVDEVCRRFDLMMLQMQIAYLQDAVAQRRFAARLMGIAEALSTKYTIAEVLAQRQLIDALRDEEYYDGLQQPDLERIKEGLRDLMRFLKDEKRGFVETKFRDSPYAVSEGSPMLYGNARQTYQRRVERFIRENRDHLTIHKLQNNEPINAFELRALEDILFDGQARGSKYDFLDIYGEQPLGTFVRGIVGLDVAAVRAAFAKFITTGHLSADQIRFVDMIIAYLTRNGMLAIEQLVTAPFNEQHEQGVFGIFEDEEALLQLKGVLDEINARAIA